jgi:antitoxin CcdA
MRMKHAHEKAKPVRRPVNVSLPSQMIDEARRFNLNVSSIAEKALESVLAEARIAAWQEEQAVGIEALNQLAERQGIPLSAHRKF